MVVTAKKTVRALPDFEAIGLRLVVEYGRNWQDGVFMGMVCLEAALSIQRYWIEPSAWGAEAHTENDSRHGRLVVSVLNRTPDPLWP